MCNLVYGKDICFYHTGGKVNVCTVYSPSQAIKFTASQDYITLGKGSKVLISDKGVDTPILLNRIKGGYLKNDCLYLYSGNSLQKAIRKCGENNISFLEGLCGVPASVGGAIKMNAGCFNNRVSDSLIYVDIIRQGKKIRLGKKDCDFSYRHSCFRENDFILGGCFKVSYDSMDKIILRLEQFNKIRKASQPSGYTVGSVFINPPSDFAGRLIERAGLKGFSHNGATISPKHANFIINEGSATSSDIYYLINYIKEKVFNMFNIKLSEEIIFLGDF